MGASDGGILAGKWPTEVKNPTLANTNNIIHVFNDETGGSCGENAPLPVIWVLILHNSRKDYGHPAALLNDLLSLHSRFIAVV